MSDSVSAQAGRAAAWALAQALFFQFWKFALPFLLAGLTAVLGYLSSTPIPWMWILFASVGVFGFAMIGTLAASLYRNLKTDRFKVRLNSAASSPAASAGSRDILLFGVEIENLANFPIYFEAISSSVRVATVTGLPSDVHLSKGVMNPLTKQSYNSIGLEVPAEWRTLANQTTSPSPPVIKEGKFHISFRYGAKPGALRNEVSLDAKVWMYLLDGKITTMFNTDDKNVRGVS